MEPLELLRRIVGMDSVFPHEANLAHFLAGELEKAGFSVEMQGFRAEDGVERFNVLATREADGRGARSGELEAGAGKPILLYGHMDTVPPYGYDAEGGRDPFRLEERDGRLYGLGAYDMKAGLAAILQAVSAVRGDRPLKVMFVSDEEADSRGCFEAARSGFVKGAGFALAAEISDIHDVTEKTRTITLGRRGRAQYEVDVPGKSFHAARASEGISAVTEAAKLAIEIDRMNETLPRHPDLSQGHMFVRSFHSESASLSLPDSAKLLIDRHLVPPENAESAKERHRKQDTLAIRGGGDEGGRRTHDHRPGEAPESPLPDALCHPEGQSGGRPALGRHKGGARRGCGVQLRDVGRRREPDCDAGRAGRVIRAGWRRRALER